MFEISINLRWILSWRRAFANSAVMGYGLFFISGLASEFLVKRGCSRRCVIRDDGRAGIPKSTAEPPAS